MSIFSESSSIGNEVNNTIGKMTNSATDIISSATSAVSGALSGVTDTLNSVSDTVSSVTGGLVSMSSITGMVSSSLGSTVKGYIGQNVTKLRTTLGKGVSLVKSASGAVNSVINSANSLSSAYTTIAGVIQNTGGNIGSGATFGVLGESDTGGSLLNTLDNSNTGSSYEEVSGQASVELIQTYEPITSYNFQIDIVKNEADTPKDLSYRVKNAQLPDTTVETYDLHYRGYKVKIPTRMNNSFQADITFWDDTRLGIYTFFNNWCLASMNIMDKAAFTRDSVLGYALLYTLDRQGYVLMTNILWDCYPETVSQVSLDYGTSDTFTFTVTLKFAYREMVTK